MIEDLDLSTRDVGVQGCPYSFSAYAFQKHLMPLGAQEARVQYLYSSRAVLSALENGSVQYGLIALESNTGGLVTESMDALTEISRESQSSLNLEGLFNCKTNHFAMRWKGAREADITHICCHPQAYEETRTILASRFPRARLRTDLLSRGKTEISDFVEMLKNSEIDRQSHILVGSPAACGHLPLHSEDLFGRRQPVITQFALLKWRSK